MIAWLSFIHAETQCAKPHEAINPFSRRSGNRTTESNLVSKAPYLCLTCYHNVLVAFLLQGAGRCSVIS